MFDIQLEVFKAVAEKLSFSQAAHDLHISQSTVSQHIQSLETRYRTKLFDRLHRGIALTQAGSRLLTYVIEIERLYVEADNAMREMQGTVGGRLHIGASLTTGEYMMPKILVNFSQLYPNVDIVKEIFNTEQITAMVMEGTIDVGFTEGPELAPGILTSLFCGGDELVIIAPANSPLAQNKPVPLQTLVSEHWVLRETTSGTHRSLATFFAQHHCDITALNIVMQLGSTQAVKEAVRAGIGIAAISHFAVAEEVNRGELKIIPLLEGPIRRRFTILYHKKKTLTYVAETFLNFVNMQCPIQS